MTDRSGCSSAWPECLPRTEEALGSNPSTQTNIEVALVSVAARDAVNVKARVRFPAPPQTKRCWCSTAACLASNQRVSVRVRCTAPRRRSSSGLGALTLNQGNVGSNPTRRAKDTGPCAGSAGDLCKIAAGRVRFSDGPPGDGRLAARTPVFQTGQRGFESHPSRQVPTPEMGEKEVCSERHGARLADGEARSLHGLTWEFESPAEYQ